MALGLIEIALFFALALGVVLLLGLGLFGERRFDRSLGEWAAAHALVLTPGNRRFVRHYLVSGRRLRTICIVGGLILPPLARIALDPAPPKGTTISFMAILGGYLVGTLWAELALTRPSAGQARAASLTPRVLSEYLPPVLRRAPRVVAALSVAAWAGAVLTRDWPSDGAVAHPVRTSSAVTWAALAVLAAVTIEAIQRWIVRRPQPIVAPDLLAADDAIRSQSVHLLGGTGTAILLCWMIAPLFHLAGNLAGPVTSLFGLAGLASFLGAVFFWRYYGNRAWRVPRRYAPVEEPMAAR